MVTISRFAESESGSESESYSFGGLWVESESDSWRHWESESDFLSDSGCPFGSLYTSHSKIGNSCWNGTISFETFVETEIYCCVPWFPLISTVKFHSLYVMESGIGVGNFGNVGVGYFISDSATLTIKTKIQHFKQIAWSDPERISSEFSSNQIKPLWRVSFQVFWGLLKSRNQTNLVKICHWRAQMIQTT